jgi:potassium channel subfamily K, other eukaryote
VCYYTAGTVIWKQLMEPGASLGDAFYFAVETFLTIGYGDITPASTAAKVFFILYTVLSLVVQLTVVTTFVSSTLHLTPKSETVSSGYGGVCTNFQPHSVLVIAVSACSKC